MRIEPATADHLRALIEGDEQFTERFGLPVADSFSSFPGVFEWSLAAIVERGVAPEWSTYLFLDDTSEPPTVVGIGGYKGPPAEGQVEIGYEIAPNSRCHGLATAASKLLIARARAAGVDVVIAHTLAGPNPSTGVLERLGFDRTEIIEDPEVGTLWRWDLPVG